MSGKRDKEIRKQARKELERLTKQNMQPNQPQQSNIGVQIIQFLENFINLYTTLIGEKPASIVLTEPMYNAYIQEAMRHAEVLGLKIGFTNDTPMFNGVKLEKKSSIIVGANTQDKPLEVTNPSTEEVKPTVN